MRSEAVPVEGVASQEMTIENGFVRVEDGEWLVSLGMPTAVQGETRASTMPPPQEGLSFWKRFFAPDRHRLSFVTLKGKMWCAVKARPFLTRIDLGETVTIVTDRLLLAPSSSRKGGRMIRIIPFSFRDAICVTEWQMGWAVVATESRTTRIVVQDGGTLSVKPSSVVAWTGNSPTGFCPRLRLRDLFLPRMPKCLSLTFHGPCIVWMEGG